MRGWVAWLVLVGGCGLAETPESAERAFAQAQQRWLARDDFAYSAWLAVDPDSSAGERARSRLSRADALYRAALDALRKGDTASSRQRFVEAAELAPIDPRHYLSLARAYSVRGMPESAAKYYGKFLRSLPDAHERTSAQRELAALELDPTEVLETPRAQPPPSSLGAGSEPSVLLGFATAVPLLLLFVWIGRERAAGKRTLGFVIDHHPELHPSIAYQIGSLRHELLKHRVAAVAQALAPDGHGASASERIPSGAERSFLRARLQGVDDAFEEHVAAFRRELGHRLSVERDPLLQRGARAARALARALPKLDDARGLLRLRAAHADLLQLDRELALLQKRLVRTRIDAEFLRELVRKVYVEADVRSAAIDDLECRAAGLPVQVEVQRSDLLLVLRNLLRNAIFAAARGEQPRLVRLEVTVELEPTGLEYVCLAVHDSSPEPITQAQIDASGLGSGLGLSAAAVRRYGGGLAVTEAAAPLRKQVCVRFARVWGESETEPGSDR